MKKNQAYSTIKSAIKKEKEDKKVQKINLFFWCLLICSGSLFSIVVLFIVDFLKNFRIGHPLYYVLAFSFIVITFVLFAIYAFTKNDFSVSDEEIIDRGKRLLQEFQIFKARGSKDYDDLQDFIVRSEEQVKEVIDGLYDMLENEAITVSPAIETLQANVMKNSRREIHDRAEARKKNQ